MNSNSIIIIAILMLMLGIAVSNINVIPNSQFLNKPDSKFINYLMQLMLNLLSIVLIPMGVEAFYKGENKSWFWLFLVMYIIFYILKYFLKDSEKGNKVTNHPILVKIISIIWNIFAAVGILSILICIFSQFK